VPARRAAWLGGALLAAGTIAASRTTAAAAATAVAIAGLVLVYDAWARGRRLAGPLAMGGCRGLNLLLGMAAAPEIMAVRWPLAFLPFVYVAVVTTVSRGEVHGGRARTGAFAFAAIASIVAAVAALAAAAGEALWALALAALLAWRVLPPFWRAARRPEPEVIRQAVRAGVLSLILLDASIAAAHAGGVYGLAVLALAPLAWGLSRLFAVT
jgi:4-hydroxybenzoate polyprenyltransferase